MNTPSSAFDTRAWEPLQSDDPRVIATAVIHDGDWDILAKRGFSLSDLHKKLASLHLNEHITIGENRQVRLLCSKKPPPKPLRYERELRRIGQLDIWCSDEGIDDTKKKAYRFSVEFDRFYCCSASAASIYHLLTFLCRSSDKLFDQPSMAFCNAHIKLHERPAIFDQETNLNDANSIMNDEGDEGVIEADNNGVLVENHNNVEVLVPVPVLVLHGPANAHDVANPAENLNGVVDAQQVTIFFNNLNGVVDTREEANMFVHIIGDVDAQIVAATVNRCNNAIYNDNMQTIQSIHDPVVLEPAMSLFFSWLADSGIALVDVHFCGIAIRSSYYLGLLSIAVLRFDNCPFLDPCPESMTHEGHDDVFTVVFNFDARVLHLGQTVSNLIPFLALSDELEHLFINFNSKAPVVHSLFDVVSPVAETLGSRLGEFVLWVDSKGDWDRQDWISSFLYVISNMPRLHTFDQLNRARPGQNVPSTAESSFWSDEELEKAFSSQYQLTEVDLQYSYRQRDTSLTKAIEPFLARNRALANTNGLCRQVESIGDNQALKALGKSLDRFGHDPNFLFHIVRSALIINSRSQEQVGNPLANLATSLTEYQGSPTMGCGGIMVPPQKEENEGTGSNVTLLPHNLKHDVSGTKTTGAAVNTNILSNALDCNNEVADSFHNAENVENQKPIGNLREHAESEALECKLESQGGDFEPRGQETEL